MPRTPLRISSAAITCFAAFAFFAKTARKKGNRAERKNIPPNSQGKSAMSGIMPSTPTSRAPSPIAMNRPEKTIAPPPMKMPTTAAMMPTGSIQTEEKTPSKAQPLLSAPAQPAEARIEKSA